MGFAHELSLPVRISMILVQRSYGRRTPERAVSVRARLRITFFLAVAVILFATSAHAARLTLEWDPSPGPAIAGYILSYRVGSGKSVNRSMLVLSSAIR